MNEKSILLIEDQSVKRWEIVKDLSTELGFELYPKTPDFLNALLSVNWTLD